MKVGFTAIAALFVLGACQTQPAGVTAAARASAPLQPTGASKTFGEASFEQIGTNKVRVSVYVQGLKPGSEHGLHIHEKGDCSEGGKASGGHFNPTGKPHGSFQSGDHHAGDLPPLAAAKDGRAKIDVEVSGLAVVPGPSSVVGRAIVVHADPDDFKTQPSGNSGTPIACGVIREG
jgi:superoxide dismutase, Cu-Zn family